MSSEDDEPEVVDSDDVEAEATADVEAEAQAASVSREEQAELRSSEARRKLRDQMQADIERFLNSGGRIEQVEPSANSQATNPAGTRDGA